jgi:hypothetical protein
MWFHSQLNMREREHEDCTALDSASMLFFP